MLGKLLHTAGTSLYPTSNNRSASFLESTTEEQHTRDLLFSNSSSSQENDLPNIRLRHGPFDDHGGLEIAESDIRIIIAQDAFRDQERPCVLLDTKKPEAAQDVNSGSRRMAEAGTVGHKRVISNMRPVDQRVVSPSSFKSLSPVAQNPGTFQSRNRSATFSGGPIESRISDDADTYLDCMFGVSSMKKTEASTKMHLISPETPKLKRPAFEVTSSPTVPPKLRREPLSRAHTQDILSKPGQNDGKASQETLLVTRLFTVTLDSGNVQADERSSLPDTGDASASAGVKPPKLKEKKVPAYAIGLVIKLPRKIPNNRGTGEGIELKSSLSSHSLRSFVGSGSTSSWTLLEALPPSLRPSDAVSDISFTRDQMEAIVKCWDVIVRSLLLLERDARKEILELLRQADKIARSSMPVKVPKEKSMQRTNQRIIQLSPYALAHTENLLSASIKILHRVRYGIRIPRVLVHSLLHIHWREEARIICRRTSQRAFFYNLFTAFLGTHTQWLCSLESQLQRKHLKSREENGQSAETMACRTVIVCEQRVLARRLIYLLASFLAPLDAHALQKSLSSESSYLSPAQKLSSPARESMLSHQIASNLRSNGSPHGGRATQLSRSTETDNSGTTENANETSFQRRPINRKLSGLVTAGGLAIPAEGDCTQKSSGGTTATVTPNVVTPTAHLSNTSSKASSYFPKPVDTDTTESLASADLARLLRRSSSGRSTRSSQWGSLLSGVSGFWSTSDKHGSSASTTGFSAPSMPLRSPGAKLAEPGPLTLQQNQDKPNNKPGQYDTLQLPSATLATSESNMQDDTSPYVSTSSVAPPRLEVDELDGVIDVDLDFSDYSFASQHISPSSLDFRQSPSSSILHKSLQTPNSAMDSPVSHSNVAGYLPQYHPDLALQAVKISPNLVEDIKASMLLEPTPVSHQSDPPQSDWTSVCTTLVADVRTFTIKRLTLKRQIRPQSSELTSVLQQTPSSESSESSESDVVSPMSSNDTQSQQIEEEMFVSETVTEYDHTLANAIESVLGQPSTSVSRVPSPSRSIHSRTVSSSTTSTTYKNTQPRSIPSSFEDPAALPMDIPSRRDYNRVVVGALEQVVRSVNDNLQSFQHSQRPDPNVAGGELEGLIPPKQNQERKEDNALREGVKRWLLKHEHANVW